MAEGYRLQVEPVAERVWLRRGDATLAATEAAMLMRETRLPDSIYLPRDALDGVALSRSDRRTFCPFKGTATYWNAEIGGERVENAFWSYEQALPESKAVEGMLGVMPALGAEFAFDGPAPAPADDGHIGGPLVDWIMREGAYCRSGEELTHQLANRFRAHGVAIHRMGVFLWSLHPEIAGTQYVWRRSDDRVETRRAPYSVLDSPAFANSPLRYVSAGLGGVRQQLDGRAPEFDFAILDDLREEGATDYVAMPLAFSDGRVNVLTLASDHPDGFTTENLGLIFECSAAIGRYYEVQTLRANAVSILDTYVGHRAGARVLSGEIRRGDGDDIEAAVLFCDLVGSTRWAEAMPRGEYLALLNGFFETVAREVGERGGEVLKFIGDAVLAVFPGEDDSESACARAAECAEAIPAAVAALNPDAPLETAIGLDFGPLTYGNVGAPNRLDFTVIGEAATIAARLSDLAKVERRPALAAGSAACKGERLGAFNLHNVSEPVEVFAL